MPSPPPKKTSTVSGLQKRYQVGEPNADAETHVPCPACKSGMVPVSIAITVRDALNLASSDPVDDDAKAGT